ncbi:MAG TPA: aspartate/glutamate racemase family protein [Ramlibacter sp.]|nr:aspartate/glutamate racemase family protein [Ramlibacter sp.]
MNSNPLPQRSEGLDAQLLYAGVFAFTRARIGVILPSVNTVVEPWFNEVMPKGVSVHATRMLLRNTLTPQELRRMDEVDGECAAVQMASCQPQAVAYCCTASSVVGGLDYDEELRQRLEERVGAPCFTAASAAIDALRAVGATRVAIASPYPTAIDEMEQDFFTSAGFQVVGSANLGISDPFRLADPSPAQIYDLARDAWTTEADALLLTCLNMRGHSVVQILEEELGKPVITSTQATLWKALRMAGIQDAIHGFGHLLSEH